MRLTQKQKIELNVVWRLKMPNWCSGDVWVKGNPKNVMKFVKLFLCDNSRTKKRYIARSFMNTSFKD